MTDGIIAEARDYGQLIDALRSRLDSLNTTMEVVDDVAGLPLRYSSKIFAPVPVKSVGKVSLGPILGALGLKLLVAVDEEMFERIRHRLTPRRNTRGGIRATPGRKRSVLLGNSDWGRVMHARWMLATTPRRRRAWARQAIAARWSRAVAR
jgi:hypothetical protein